MLITEDLIIFLKSIIGGMGIGIIFDFFRILRKLIKHNDILVIIQDIIFWIFTGTYLFVLIYFINMGQIRFYILLGVILSNVIYILIFSKYIIKIILAIFIPFKIINNKIQQKVKDFSKNA